MKDTYTREEILAALTIEPCDITGMHDPTHTTRYICDAQLTKAVKGLLDLLNVAPEGLPRRAGPHEAGRTERLAVTGTASYKRQQIERLAWIAGAPMDLFKPGADEPQDGDDDLVLGVLTDEWQTWQDATRQLPFGSDRYWNVVKGLHERGLVDRRDISTRLHQEAEVPA